MVSGGSLSGALKLLGVPPNDPRIRNVFSKLLEKYSLPRSYDYLNNRMTFTREQLVAAIENSISVTDVLNHLGFKNHGANYKTIKKCIIQWNLNTDHFDRRASAIKNKKVYSTQDIFCKDSTYARGGLGKAVRKHKIFQAEKCSKCNITDWNNEPLSLQIDHINGINTDNRIENLRLLCPNCHSQTPNFSGRSSKKVGRM